MTDRIEPALSENAWIDVKAGYGIPYACGSSILDELSMLEGRDIPAAIAYLNHELPASDDRKITQETVRAILAARATYPLGSASHRELIQIAAALASYLPADQRPVELGAAYAAYLPPEGTHGHQ